VMSFCKYEKWLWWHKLRLMKYLYEEQRLRYRLL
jgi:hypothetical protein